MKYKTILTITALFTSLNLQAEKKEYSIEIDPSTYALGGYSLHLKKRFDSIPNVQFGVGAYAMDFPDVFVDMHSKNRDKGWDVRLDNGVGLFTDVYQDETLSGWFYGTQIAFQRYKIDNIGGSSSYDTFLLMGHGGYKYNMNDQWYLKFWGGVGYSHKFSGSNRVGNLEYDVPTVVPFGALHIGYNY